MRPNPNHSVSLALVSILLAVAPFAVLSPPASAAAAAGGSRTTLPAVEGQVMCVTCKIPLSLAQSPQASRERAFIQRLVSAGRTEAQIERSLVREYGPSVLALPSARGFGLAAYLVPVAFFLAPLAALALLLLRRRRFAPDSSSGDTSSPALGPADAARLDADIARFR